MRFGDVIISATVSSKMFTNRYPIGYYKAAALFFFSNLIVVKFGLKFTAFATVYRKHFEMTG